VNFIIFPLPTNFNVKLSAQSLCLPPNDFRKTTRKQPSSFQDRLLSGGLGGVPSVYEGDCFGRLRYAAWRWKGCRESWSDENENGARKVVDVNTAECGGERFVVGIISGRKISSVTISLHSLLPQKNG